MEFHRHSQYILEQFNQQREMGMLCDCTFMVDGVVFKAHKAVLAACSQYFRMLFVEHKEVVDLDISSSEGLGIVLDFMYTGILNLTSETVDSVLAVASFLQMQAVTVSCRVFKSPQKTGAGSVHTGARNTSRIKSLVKKTNAPMRAEKVLTWEVHPLSTGETPESVGTGPAGRLTLRLKQEEGQSAVEPAGMEVEQEDSESEETEDVESEIKVEVEEEDEEALVYVDDVCDVDYTPDNSVNDAVSKSCGVRWQGGTKSCRRDNPAGDDWNQTNRKELHMDSADPTDQVTANRRAPKRRQQRNHSERIKHRKRGTVAHTCELSLMEQKQSHHSSLDDVRYFLSTGQCPTHLDKTKKMSLRKYAKNFRFEDTGLFYCNPKINNLRRVVFAEEEKEAIFRDCHGPPHGAHQGRNRTAQKISSKYYWQSMMGFITSRIKGCDKCQHRKKIETGPGEDTSRHNTSPGGPWG
ncbi:zinc finger and BTB domain-containing protein 17-like isoform X1 [Polyodon spathula]|uniref:zinc finger and BTB domain-containing protein 17-like isoform X1 n=1 Tax=Polyodon spathula TaxID=7913 RepID=UPI001B7E985B|nr:zinc finger and BTB domain-containing protein 17-like isoform X1 [Polyodon spathula]